MFDASEIFTGAHVNWAFDVTSVGKNCPLYKEEFVEGEGDVDGARFAE